MVNELPLSDCPTPLISYARVATDWFWFRLAV